ncbi:response regulator transcription factor [Actinomadura algeriensis]|uniref:DNA-binding NarL/FixJ family response regulator n=1 Tax=Actinomadura algeriensis TaxID=1679523 RepID=A0ABR9K1I6_9ACTN|nr:response regulator transcription factor [Actinomadura algeriensis]MBE1536705.1 DNA-binding NarL/FixJ family response regulator [Actinomadura algeriensis]
MGGDPLEPRRITVGVIDDHPVVIEGVRAWLACDPRIEVAHVADTVDDVPAGLDVLILDLNLHGRLVLPEVAELAGRTQRVITFSQLTERETVLAALDAGACEFVAKNEGRDHLLEAVLTVAADRPYVTPTAAGVLAADELAAGERGTALRLSERERTALLLWFQSMSKASVARRMGVSVHTVEMYIKRARVKYAQAGRPAPTKADMLARAIEDGLIRPEEIVGYRSSATSPDASPPLSTSLVT